MVSKKGKGSGKDTLYTGKRKTAIARANFQPGKGIIKINSVPLGLVKNEIIRMKIQEPLMVIGEDWKKYDVSINVRGGGLMGQADAARQALAKGFAETLGSETKKRMMDYDKFMLVADSRRTEPHKPPRSSQGARRYKQRSKR